MAVDIFCDGDSGINTALGCIPVDSPTSFIGWFLPGLFGLVGGFAILLMIFGGIKIITAGGDAQKIKGGQETITSAISGLLFAVFSLFILRLIGVDILHIPGLE